MCACVDLVDDAELVLAEGASEQGSCSSACRSS